MTVFSIGFTLFLIMNSLGLIPLILHLTRECTSRQRKKIIIREMLIALIIILIFNFAGVLFFDWLEIDSSTIRMAGGLILFLIAIKMIFPGPKKQEHSEETELPFIVPIATPLVAGPSLLSAVMIQAKEVPNMTIMLWAIFSAWIATTIIFLGAASIKRVVGDKGLNAFQRFMGLILTLVAVQMFLQGVSAFAANLFPPNT